MAITVCGEDRRFGLAFSGGGFRASLFHLGVLRRLHELGLHENIDYISSVSGGSIVAAVYCLRKPKKPCEFVDLERCILQGIKSNPRMRWFGYWAIIVAFILAVSAAGLCGLHRAIGLWSLTAWFVMLLWFILVLLIPRWRSIHPMAWVFERCFDLKEKRLSDAAPEPGFSTLLMMNATSLARGMRWVFSPAFVGTDSGACGKDADMIFHYFSAQPPTINERADVPLSAAMLASACFPPFFRPYELRFPQKNNQDQIESVGLVDGGVYDNQGFRIFMRWLRAAAPESRVDYLLASDAAQPMSEKLGLLSRVPLVGNLSALFRSAIIEGKADRDEAYELLFQQVGTTSPRLRQFALFFIGGEPVRSARTAPAPYAVPPHPARTQSYGLPAYFKRVLSQMRTDFDYFSDLEMRVLMYHGYSLATHRIINYCPEILEEKYPGFCKMVAITARAVGTPFDWSDLPGGSIPFGLRHMATWQEFNKRLEGDHRKLFRSNSRWRNFFGIVDFARPHTRKETRRAQRYLCRSQHHLAIYRWLLRGWDCLVGS